MDIKKLELFKEKYFWPHYVPHSAVIKAFKENEEMKKKYAILKNTKKTGTVEFMRINGKIIW